MTEQGGRGGRLRRVIVTLVASALAIGAVLAYELHRTALRPFTPAELQADERFTVLLPGGAGTRREPEAPDGEAAGDVGRVVEWTAAGRGVQYVVDAITLPEGVVGGKPEQTFDAFVESAETQRDMRVTRSAKWRHEAGPGRELRCELTVEEATYHGAIRLVLVEDRLISLEAYATDPGLLDGEDVRAFLDSLEVPEPE